MNKFKLLYPFLLTVFLAGGVLIGYKIAPGYVGNVSTGNYNKIRDIIEIIDRKYVDTVDSDKLFESTIQELLRKLDPHSAYISKEDLIAAKERVDGAFGGIGVRFFMLRDTVSITNVIKNSPSMIAGLHSGDKIIKVGDKTIAGKSLPNDEIMRLLKGAPNTIVKVTILRNGALLKKEITRGLIPYNSVSAFYMLDNKIGYIKIDEFSKATADEFKEATILLESAGMSKLVLDLRSNGGGVLESAIRIVDEFLPKGKLIVTTKGKNFPKEDIYSTNYGRLDKIPVVVIINESSASASEIVAGALQDHDRATIIGRRSFGKGLVQQDIPLSDGSDLRLVVARYYTPTGRCIQKPYSGNYEEYMHEYYDRYEDGEVYSADSVKIADSLKYYTPKGKIVYGGGGIYPDVFIPLDSTKNSWYIAELYYKGVFQAFAFDFVSGKRSQWKDMYDYNKLFVVTDQMIHQFNNYISKHYDIVTDILVGTTQSNLRLKEILKAEIARQLWEEKAYYYMSIKSDKEVMKSIEILTK